MTITTYKRLPWFDFWSGGAQNAEQFTFTQLEELDEILDEMYPEGIDETELNDLFWFEPDYLAELLGFESFDELVEYNNADDE